MNSPSESTKAFTFRAIELFARNELNCAQEGRQPMHKNLTAVSLVIALTAGAMYHLAVLIALAATLA
jgi:hypothetical protein